MKVADILAALDTLAPFAGAAAWDNTGLIVGDGAQEVRRVLVSNEVTLAVIAEAKEQKAELLLSYHPPLLRGVSRLGPEGAGATLFAAARANLAIISVHTAWDAAQGGVNDVLAERAGLVPAACTALCEGMGRIGELRQPTTLSQLAQAVREGMGVAFALVAGGQVAGEVRRVAVAAGAGDSFVTAALEQRAQVLVTGELRHHELLRLLAGGAAAICLTHCGSERAALCALLEALAQRLGPRAVQLALAAADAAPYRLA